MMGRILSRNFVSAIAVAASLGVSGMALPATAATLNMAWSQDATGLDPHKQTAFSSLRLLELVYEPLVRTDSKLNIVPAVAQSWAFSEDGKTLTFKLNPDSTFSNGDKVLSSDVKASFERILNEATGASARANFLSIESIDTPDDETVVFNLSQPDVPLLTAMSSINAAIMPQSAIKAGNVGTQTIGSGPFVLDSWDPNSREVLGVNENWAGGTVGVDGINISVLPDETAILAALRTHQVDFALINDPLVATLVPNNPGLTLNREPVLNYHVLQLNADEGAMKELKVRQAISCAIDRQDVLDAALLGEGKVTGPLTMPAFATDPSDLFCYTPDLEKAKALMKEAGYEDGFSASVMAATGEPPTAASEAQVIQSQLAEIGIDLDIEMMELNVYIDRWLKGDFDMAVALNGGRTDPYTMYNRYWTKDGNLNHVAHYIDDELDTLMNEGRVETDPEKRKAIFAEFSKHITDVSPWIWLYTGYSYTASSDKVTGFEASPTGSLFGLSSVTVSE